MPRFDFKNSENLRGDENSCHEYIQELEYRVWELERAVTFFCDRVESGAARSRVTYSRFKMLMGEHLDGKVEQILTPEEFQDLLEHGHFD